MKCVKSILKDILFLHQIDPMNRERATAILMDFCHTKLRFQEEKYRNAEYTAAA